MGRRDMLMVVALEGVGVCCVCLLMALISSVTGPVVWTWVRVVLW